MFLLGFVTSFLCLSLVYAKFSFWYLNHSFLILETYQHDFHSAKLHFMYIIQGLNQGPKNKVPIVGTALVNIAEYVSAAEQKELELNIPLISCSGSAEACATLCVCSFAFCYAYHNILVSGNYAFSFVR